MTRRPTERTTERGPEREAGTVAVAGANKDQAGALAPLLGVPAAAYPAVQVDELGLHGALAPLSLNVPRGALCCVLAPGGGGKTVLLRLLAGLARPSSGRTLVLGCDPSRQRAALHGRAAYLAPERVLQPEVPLARQAAAVARAQGLAVDATAGRYRALLIRLGLRDRLDQRAAALPSGARRLAEAALAIATGAELLLLDDLQGGLDEGERDVLWRVLDERRAAGVTVIYGARDPAEAERASLLVLLQAGRTLAAGSPLALRLRHAGGWPVLLHLPPQVTILPLRPPAPPVAAPGAGQTVPPETTPETKKDTPQRRVLARLREAGYRVLTSANLNDPHEPDLLAVVLPPAAEPTLGPEPARLAALADLLRLSVTGGEARLEPRLPDLAAVQRALLAQAP